MYKFQAVNKIINWYRELKRNNRLTCWECGIRRGDEYSSGMCDKCYHIYREFGRDMYMFAQYVEDNELVSMDRTCERCYILKEDLMSECFRPDRVEKWLEIGGHELLETMFM